MAQQIKLKRSVIAVALTLATSHVVMAQVTSIEPAIQKVTVTGSNIKRIDIETASPVQVLGHLEILQSGANTVREILDNLTSNTGALSDKGGSSSFASGASGVSLRQLGKSSTLVLLNGRRVSNYGFADGAQETFVNIDTIPAAIIDRIEILKDGASAIYGSDAVAGVINIITRKEFKGVQLNVAAQKAGSNKFTDKEKTASITGGLGDLAKDGFNILAHLEVFKRDPFTTRSVLDKADPWFKDYVNPNVGVRSTYSYPGNFIRTAGNGVTGPAPGCAAENIEGGLCRFDQWARVEQSPAADRLNFLSSGRMDLSNGISAFSEIQYSKTKSTYQNTPAIMQYTGSPLTWFNAKTGTVATFTEPLLPANNTFNPFGAPVQLRYRYADDVGIFKRASQASQYRVVVGFEGTSAGWDWNTAAGSMGSKAESRSRGGKSAKGYLDAINSGEYKFAGTNSADLLLRMFPNYGTDGESTTHFIDAKATHELMTLPGGQMAVAVGVDFRRETFKQISSANVQNAEIVQNGATNISGNRNLAAAYVELDAPITKQLNANFALRADKASTADASLVPKFGLSYRPMSTVLLRGTVAEGFRAPNLPETGEGYVTAFSSSLEDPKRCADATKLYNILKTGNALDVADALRARDSGCRIQPGLLIVPNKQLEAEKSKSYTLGFVLEPSKHITVAMDYFNIKRRNEIGTKAVDQVLAQEDNKPGSVTRNPISADDLALSARAKELSGQDINFTRGQVSVIKSRYENQNKTRVSGIDLDVNSRWDLGSVGKLAVGMEATYNLDYRGWDENLNDYTENLVGNYGNYRVVTVGKISLESGKWVTGARVNYSSATSLNDNIYDNNNSAQGCADRGIPTSYCRLSTDTTVDFSLQYKGFKDQSIVLNIGNIFNRRALVNVRAGNPPLRDRVVRLSYEYKY